MERGYHVGYMLCQNSEIRASLTLPLASELKYIGQTGTLISPGWDDAQELADTLTSLERIGVNSEDRDRLWRVVAALLLLGELDFGPDDASEAKITDAALTAKLSALIEVASAGPGS
jgi:myosin heavy subunit